MGGFDTLALGSKILFGDNWFSDFNAALHESSIYNIAQTTIASVAVFTGGMNSGFNKAANSAGVKPSCFVAGTLVMAVAGMVAIETIKSGDKVISTDPETFETSEKTVLETFVMENSKLIHLVINGEEIVTTESHPFYVKDKGFINAGELDVGDELLDSSGNVLLLESLEIELTSNPTTVYNFQVEDFHTYYVGENCVWVHNAECGGSYEKVRKLNKEDNLGKQRREQSDAHHMPANDSYPDDVKNTVGTYDKKVNGPSISMKSSDHTKTNSYGSSKSAREYRAKQRELIKAGKIQDAFDMDVADIMSRFPGKYDSSIKEAQQYMNKLLKDGKAK